jgi:hypothetical protein
MNSVASISLRLTASNEPFVHGLYGDFGRFSEVHLSAVVDRVLARCAEEGTEVEIARLDIDLGIIPEEEFGRRFEYLLEQKLEDAVRRQLLYPGTRTVKKETDAGYLAKALFAFLLHGTLPWNLANNFKNIASLFRKVLAELPGELSAFLRNYGHYSSLQQRLVYQLGDEELLEGVRLIAPAEQGFIAAYVRYVRSRHLRKGKTIVGEQERRNAAWKVVYAYLLTNQGTVFNRKIFVRETIAGLAAHFNRTYSELLVLLAEVPESESAEIIPSGLRNILSQLNREEVSGEREKRLKNPSEWKILLREARISGKEFFAVRDLAILRSLLMNGEKARVLIRTMDEEEIFGIVRLIAPGDAEFVIGYSGHLDRQRENGALRGKTGGDFMHFKWQLILPLIALAGTSGVNRAYFAWTIFRKLSARYNVAVAALLGFALNETEKLKLGGGLRKLLESLRMELPQANVSETSMQHFDEVHDFAFAIAEKRKLTAALLAALRKSFRLERFRELLTDQLGEPHRFLLLEMVYPKASRALAPFIRELGSGSRKWIPEARDSGFTRAKWTFVFAVLEETRDQAFNYAGVVRRILVRTASHYNISLEKLVDYLHADLLSAHRDLPFSLIAVLASLKSGLARKSGSVYGGITESEYLENRKVLARWFAASSCEKHLDELAARPDFARFMASALEAGLALNDLARQNWNAGLDRSEILALLLRLSRRPDLGNRVKLLEAFVLFLCRRLRSSEKQAFAIEYRRLSRTHAVLKDVELPFKIHEKEIPAKDELAQEQMNDPWIMETERETFFLENAGISLIAPFLPRLFSMLGLTANGTFADEGSQIKAVFLAQYAVFGEAQAEFPEFALMLNRILTGLPEDVPLPASCELSEDEKETVNGMLGGILQNWSKLSNTTVDGLREAFLQREGKLERQDDLWVLTVEEKPFDMLLDSLPWSFKSLKFGWMAKGVQVKWR